MNKFKIMLQRILAISQISHETAEFVERFGSTGQMLSISDSRDIPKYLTVTKFVQIVI